MFCIYDGTDVARKARAFAEAAFFQPSVMSLLHFPAEHQQAIYMVFLSGSVCG
jgi:phosphatidylinositol glycan class S